MPRWCDLFTPRQLLGHLTLIDGLNRLKPDILAELGTDRGRAVITYLQFAIDKGLDYNSRQTLWHSNRGVVAHTFTRHDFSLKWTFSEMIFSGSNSGAAWTLSQITSVYKQIATYVQEVTPRVRSGDLPLPTILNNTAAHMPSLTDSSVDLVCMDPPYYDNVQYGELSDYFYVWQKRTLGDLYPELFIRRLVDKIVEAVANPARDGSAKAAKLAYEQMMGQIFAECQRVLKDDGLMTLMFTHKTQGYCWPTLRGREWAILLGGQSTGPSQTVCSLHVVRDNLQNFGRRKSLCGACTDTGEPAEKVERYCPIAGAS